MITTVTLALLCNNCLDPFPLPDLNSGLLIIDARFTDNPEENRVVLSYAGMMNEGRSPVNGARVFVSDNFGNTGQFQEDERGLYLPVSEDYLGIAGRKYVLHIELNNGRQYRSDSCLFRDVPPIENLEWKTKQAPSPDNTKWLNGLEFSVDTRDPDNEIRYFLWTYDEAWETPIPTPILDIYLGDGEFRMVNDPNYCYTSDVSSDIRVKSTADQSESVIRDHPIAFISTESTRLTRKYWIRVRQFGLSEEAFFYHEKLQEMTEQTGSIFDKQPFTLRGNIRNIENPDEIVMGYFLVSGVSTSSVKINANDLPVGYAGVDERYTYCMRRSYIYNVDTNVDFEYIFNRLVPRWNLVFVSREWEETEMGFDSLLIGLRFAPEDCIDCWGFSEVPDILE